MLEVKVEIWSDFTCPYCYLGYKNLEAALEQAQLKERAKIEYKSLRLEFSTAAKANETEYIYHMMKEEKNIPIEKVNEIIKQMNEQAERVGITFRFDHIKYTDTFNAHRLTKFAKSEGKDQEIILSIFKKYFSQNKDISKKEVLLQIADEVGLDEKEVDALLCLNQYAKSVTADEEIAEEIGIDKVPFFIFNEQFAVAGAQPIEVFLDVLEEVKQELNGKWEQEESAVETCETMYCSGSDCDR